MGTVKGIPARDWEAMSWYQQKRWIDRYAKTHQWALDDSDEPALSPVECPGCGGVKRAYAKVCRSCYDKNPKGAADRFKQILDIIRRDPDITGPQLAEAVGYGYTDHAYRLLRRNGREDLVTRVKANGRAHAAAASMQRRNEAA